MIPCKPTGQRLTLILLSFVVLFSINKVSAQGGDAAAGKQIFSANCASCHKMGADLTGPNLDGVETRWPDVSHLHQWIKNWNVAVANGWPEAVAAQNLKPTAMNTFEFLADKDIDNVIAYITTWEPTVVSKEGPPGPDDKSSSHNAVIFGVISLILFVIALIMMQVNSNLKKMSDDASGIQRPEPVPFYRNKVYIALAAIIFFVLGGYFLAMGAIGLGRQKHYEPEQPIYYSHKIHAGVNQINCLYCHGNAWESKTAAIPSVNVCMNCHKAIQTYGENSPKLYREDGTQINGTMEIQKLYEYAGFDPKNADAWDPSKAKPIPWKKIHNLPDHVYFNHSQHVRAGKVQCQTCHGEITAMDEVRQESELSMGWCVNCHRQTKVDFNYDSTGGNKYYSIYEKFHNDLKPDTAKNRDGSYRMDNEGNLIITKSKRDSIRVVDIGGLECQKCHY
ncbi:MAG TPA: c-type cytochrome [Chitinophagaceae bacterium]|nr:c-type cytochrome [Chitinophagaceae bacterium]